MAVFRCRCPAISMLPMPHWSWRYCCSMACRSTRPATSCRRSVRRQGACSAWPRMAPRLCRLRAYTRMRSRLHYAHCVRTAAADSGACSVAAVIATPASDRKWARLPNGTRLYRRSRPTIRVPKMPRTSSTKSLAGLTQRDKLTIIEDRAAAIAWAIEQARRITTSCCIAGKGHENYQEIAGRRRPFSDYAIAEARSECQEGGCMIATLKQAADKHAGRAARYGPRVCRRQHGYPHDCRKASCSSRCRARILTVAITSRTARKRVRPAPSSANRSTRASPQIEVDDAQRQRWAVSAQPGAVNMM